MTKPTVHNFEQSEDPGLVFEEADPVFSGYIGHGPGHFEEMDIVLGLDEGRKWDVLWQLDENDFDDPTPLAWVEAGRLKGKELATALVRAWFTGLHEGQGATEPPYDEILSTTHLLSRKELTKLTREIFG